MKTKILFYIAFLITNVGMSQITTIGFGQGYTLFDAPPGTYIKDINNQFDKFNGIWKYENNNEIVIFKLEKVSQYHHISTNTYQDFMIGNYSYSIDGGLTYVVNTITQNIGNNDPNINPLYSCCPYDTDTSIDFSFVDVIHQKNSDASFTFEAGTLNMLRLKLTNRFGGYILPNLPPSPDFCIPNDIILIKQ